MTPSVVIAVDTITRRMRTPRVRFAASLSGGPGVGPRKDITELSWPGKAHDDLDPRRAPRDPSRRPRTLRPLPRGVLALARARPLSRGVRPGAHRARLARRTHSRGVRRRGPRRHRGERHPRGDQRVGRQRRRVPCPDVHDGHAPPARERGAEAALPAADRGRRAPVAGVRRDRADGRVGHDADPDERPTRGRRLRDPRAEDLDVAGALLGSHAAPRANDAVRGGRAQERRHLRLPRST